MKIDDVIKRLQDFRAKHGNVECVAFTLEHGPFDLGFCEQEEDEGQYAHVQFGPEPEFDMDDKIFKE